MSVNSTQCDSNVGQSTQCDNNVGQSTQCDNNVGPSTRCDNNVGQSTQCDNNVGQQYTVWQQCRSKYRTFATFRAFLAHVSMVRLIRAVQDAKLAKPFNIFILFSDVLSVIHLNTWITDRHATWYGLSVSNTDFGLFWDDTAVSPCDTDLRQNTEKQLMNYV